MKKHIILTLSAMAVFGFSGCGSSGNNHYEDDLVTLFLVDDLGFSYGGVPYKCDSMSNWEVTLPNGEFTFLPPDNCEFDFLGLDGNLFDDPRVDDIVRIVDFTNDGKRGIPYECASFSGVDSTRYDGSFEYDIDDQCVFYL